MKIRTGFVSNSSSSSFVLPIKDGENSKITLEFTLSDLMDMISSSMDGRLDETVRTIEDLQMMYMERFGYDDMTFEELLKEEGEWMAESYEDEKRLIEEGYILMVGRIDHSETIAQSILEKMGGKVEY